MKRRPPNAPSDWSRSPQWRAIGREAITRWNRTRHLEPRCGATAKHNGEACRQLAMANGRCAYHGGRTPKGAGWHRPRWPDKGSPDAVQKAMRKVSDRERAEKKRARRLAAMTPDERQRHEAWQRTHKPGPPGPRAAARADRAHAKAARAQFERSEPTPVSSEVAELLATADMLRAKLAEIEARATRDAATPFDAFS